MKKSCLIYAFVFAFICVANLSWAVVENFDRIKVISDSVLIETKAVTDEAKVIALSHYVYTKLKPDASKGIGPFDKMSTTDRLDVGVGWCNHQVAVFMRLCEAQKIKTRMLYLTNKEGTSSPHTIGEAYVDGRWVVVDPMFDMVLRNAEGKLVSLKDIIKNPSILKTVPLVYARIDENYGGDEKLLDEWVDNFTNPTMFVYGLE